VESTRTLRKLVKFVVSTEAIALGQISVIICRDSYLLQINKEYLNRNYLTDIITFSYDIEQGVSMAELYISYDRIVENAEIFKQSTNDELRRIIIHGLLHIAGYNDLKDSEKEIMTKREDYHMMKFQQYVSRETNSKENDF